MYTVEIAKDYHIEPSNEVAFLTHSCSPNLGMKGNINFVAIKEIEIGQEINFDYAMTEYEIACPFTCPSCSKDCRIDIEGYKTLPERFKERYKGYISNHLLE